MNMRVKHISLLYRRSFITTRSVVHSQCSNRDQVLSETGRRTTVNCLRATMNATSYRPAISAVGRIMGLAVVAPILSNTAQNEQVNKTEDESIGVYLKPESKVLLHEYLAGRGIHGNAAPYVAIVRHASPEEAFVYKPLYGQRAAFRIKGVIQGASTGIAVTGRLSTMVGELKEDSYEPCLPVFVGDQLSLHAANEIADLPTRRVHVKGMKHDSVWKGRLPSDAVRGEKYSALAGMTFLPVPRDKQIVIEGYICSSRYVDEAGNCLYDRSQDGDFGANGTSGGSTSSSPLTTSVPAAMTNDHPDEDVQQGGTENEENKPECPVCKYMKGGPCKDEFLAWDDCVQSATEENLQLKCFPATSLMMRCMQKHEYYDIMTAGTDFRRLDHADGVGSAAPPAEQVSP
jgi:hypothetical protein